MDPDYVRIAFGTFLYVLYCQTCGKVEKVRPERTQLTCVRCGGKLGEPMDPEYVKHLMERGTIQ